MRALALALLATGAAAQTPEFDPTSPYYVQQQTDAGWLVESLGRQYLCPSIEPVGPVLVPSDCALFGTVVEGRTAGTAQVAETEQILTVLRIVENMPEPAFRAALTDLIVQWGCVLDFADYEATQAALIDGMRGQFGLPERVADTIDPILQRRIGATFDAMSDAFVVDEDNRTATLLEQCD